MPGGKRHEVQQGRNELHGMQNEWHCMQVMRGERLLMLGRPGSGIAAIDARWRCAYRAYALGEGLFRGRCRRGFWTNFYSGNNAGEGFGRTFIPSTMPEGFGRMFIPTTMPEGFGRMFIPATMPEGVLGGRLFRDGTREGFGRSFISGIRLGYFCRPGKRSAARQACPKSPRQNRALTPIVYK